MIDRSILDAHLGKDIGKICGIGYDKPHDNHCAHFVSHVLGFRFGYTCGGLKRPETLHQIGGDVASIKVQEVFGKCTSVGKWEQKPVVLVQCLVFITAPSDVNLTTRHMENVPRKHVGIFSDGLIWHYSNSHHKVVNQTPEQFTHHYPAPHNSLFYGHIPWVPPLRRSPY